MDPLSKHLMKLYDERVKIPMREKSTAVKFTDTKLKRILENIDDDLYSITTIKAGSHPSGTKVIRANEFDYNVRIKVANQIQKVKFEGEKVPYKIVQSLKRTERKRMESKHRVKRLKTEPFFTERRQPVPSGCVAVKLKTSFDYQNCAYMNYLIPMLIKEDFRRKIKESCTNANLDVVVASTPHGPAITINLKGSRDRSDISVDLSPTIEWKKITLEEFGWPREETLECMSEDLIDQVEKAGTHLVPKSDEFWNISFSTAEKILMLHIDEDDGCRKICHKILKYHFEKWNRNKEFPGVTTHIFKNLLFWFNEKYEVDWRKENVGDCYLQLLQYLLKKLESQRLPNYFDGRGNLLRNIDGDILRKLGDIILREIQTLHELEDDDENEDEDEDGDEDNDGDEYEDDDEDEDEDDE